MDPQTPRLAPDSINRLERAAELRFQDADFLPKDRRLTAVYLYGYCVEMCLTAAYFRSVGFSPNAEIDRDTRQRRMAQARQLQTLAGEALMNSDSHPLVGWARFLNYQRSLSDLSPVDKQRLSEAIKKAEQVYKHWRPELRYKTKDVLEQARHTVRAAALWFLDNRGRL